MATDSKEDTRSIASNTEDFAVLPGYECASQLLPITVTMETVYRLFSIASKTEVKLDANKAAEYGLSANLAPNMIKVGHMCHGCFVQAHESTQAIKFHTENISDYLDNILRILKKGEPADLKEGLPSELKALKTSYTVCKEMAEKCSKKFKNTKAVMNNLAMLGKEEHSKEKLRQSTSDDSDKLKTEIEVVQQLFDGISGSTPDEEVKHKKLEEDYQKNKKRAELCCKFIKLLEEQELEASQTRKADLKKITKALGNAVKHVQELSNFWGACVFLFADLLTKVKHGLSPIIDQFGSRCSQQKVTREMVKQCEKYSVKVKDPMKEVHTTCEEYFKLSAAYFLPGINTLKALLDEKDGPKQTQLKAEVHDILNTMENEVFAHTRYKVLPPIQPGDEKKGKKSRGNKQ